MTTTATADFDRAYAELEALVIGLVLAIGRLLAW